MAIRRVRIALVLVSFAGCGDGSDDDDTVTMGGVPESIVVLGDSVAAGER